MVHTTGEADEEFSSAHRADAEFYAHYDAGDILGQGLSSVVRKCTSKTTGEMFAVKIVDKTQDPDIERAIKEEIRALEDVCPHKHIVSLKDSFESSAFFFLIFELAQGGELFDYLTKVIRLSEKKTRTIMRELLAAVQHIHERGYVHRDLKPENILMDADMKVKLSDFGFATPYRGVTLRDLCGTPAYLAPEMLRCTVDFFAPGYDNEVDLWACGVIMYTMLAGFPPFWHRKQMVMLRSIMEGKYKFSSPEWDDISDGAKDLIRQLLCLDPTKRLSAVEALNHPWMTISLQRSEQEFSPRRKFKVYILAVLFTMTIGHVQEAPVSLMSISSAPYRYRFMRKLIDECAFKIYGHWVKRGDNQNRATLFENQPKTELFKYSGSSPHASLKLESFHPY
ncbi:phosphorylase b kinase gamma catalytic chain, liver/testis isoform-like isoform X2 [Oscarella lobularis]|uniref:phosphorylase b kinase gamma catalytic chain, liver/testis isoform-like isoform X2 n=1 Tax=Oscarella lobularis TaxID=121494 RepID=UPI003313717A